MREDNILVLLKNKKHKEENIQIDQRTLYDERSQEKLF